MGRIQSNIGLISGVPIGDTVDQLMALAARPRDMLAARNERVKKEQVAVTELSALLLSVRYVTESLGKETLFETRTATSSNEAALAATVTGEAAEGSYQFTPLRAAQRQQLLSSGFKSDKEAIGSGKLTFRFGPHVQRSLPLDQLNGGQGITRGLIRITDRSGTTAEIDLSTAQTLDDVLSAINDNLTINVTAVAAGDRIRLVDNTGQAVSNLKVQEVGRGTTAQSLGLAGIDVAASTADGEDLVRLTEDSLLDLLNEGSGVEVIAVLPDIRYRLRDGTTGEIDFSPLTPDTPQVQKETTLGEILEVINQAAPGKLKAEISADGDRLVVTDLTQGENTFKLDSPYGGTALASLGLESQAVDGVITGRRLLGGLKSALLSGLNGGRGLGQLGTLSLTDRSGVTATVDLAGSETLDEVVERINAAAVDITARVNRAKNGIELVDTSGATAGPLIVANGDGTNTADKLGIAVNAAVDSVNSGDLHLQVVSRNTRLADLNGGAGVARGTFEITDSSGRQARISLGDPTIESVGDVIDLINRSGVSVLAEINETGDGIRIRDVARGSGRMSIVDLTTTAAADLRLAGTAVDEDFNGTTMQVIDGSMTTTVNLDPGETLGSLVSQINALGVHVTASTLVDGSTRPYRLTLASNLTGEAGNLVVDTSGVDFELEETVHGSDALLALGAVTPGGNNVLVSSATNKFSNVVAGVRLEVKQPSAAPVTVSINTTDSDLVANVKVMVDNYNKFRKRLNELSAYDVDANKRSLLTGDSTALRLDTDLPRLLSDRFLVGAGSVQSLGELGVGLKDDGTLTFDESRLKARFQEDPEGVKRFFTDKDAGFSKRFKELTDQLVGPDTSLLAQRFKSLQKKIDENTEKLEEMDERLERERNRLLLSFYHMESAIAKLQGNMSMLSSLQPLPPMTGGSGEK